MSKFSKGKNIGIITAALASVALVGVGFSTWVIGAQNTTTDGDISLSADTVEFKSMSLSVKFKEDMVLAENNKTGDFAVTGDLTPKMTISTEFTFSFGKDFKAEDFKWNKIHLAIKTATGDYKDNMVAAADKKITREGDNFTYFDLAESGNIDIAASELLTDITTSGNFKDKTITKDVVFNWGTFFGGNNKAPSEYYAEGYNSASDKKKYMSDAYDELSAMHNKYNGVQIKIDVSLSDATNTNA